jgi:glycosyltransferase involved in cell wall biosynthesis
MSPEPRIGILVVAYNAATTLARVLDRIPREFAPKIAEILVSDDSSQDSTYLVGMGYRQVRDDLPLTIIRQEANLGYGGNQKVGYEWAIERGLDIVVLLHGDGQYAPELLPDIVAPLERGECDAVFGSRMLERGEARKGGMPLYKYVGNRILTRFENYLAGASLSEWHSGYRAYSVKALKDVPFQRNSDGFDFDTQIILEFLDAGKRIHEIPIPTYYGDEVCYVNGLGYAKDITRHALNYRLSKAGFGAGDPTIGNPAAYERKTDWDSSHAQIIAWMERRSPGRILDVGCSDGALGADLQALGHRVTGVDIDEIDGVRKNVATFVRADLDQGIPDDVGDAFETILAADVLEHVRNPGSLLAAIRERVADGGSVIVSIPNFAHWYPRFRVLTGSFDYDRRGILDRTHLRFFTQHSFERLAGAHGLRIRRRQCVGLPIEVFHRVGSEAPATGRLGRVVKALDKIACSIHPNLFAYQYVYELEPITSAKSETVVDRRQSSKKPA